MSKVESRNSESNRPTRTTRTSSRTTRPATGASARAAAPRAAEAAPVRMATTAERLRARSEGAITHSAVAARLNDLLPEASGARARGGGAASSADDVTRSRRADPYEPNLAELPPAIRKYAPQIEAAARKYEIPAALIAAVMDRETNGRNIIGDGGHGHGLMQIDDRSHGTWLRGHQNGLDPASNIDYGTSILRDNLKRAKGLGLRGDAAFRYAAAAYNAGPGGADRGRRAGDVDRYTTGHNYGRDVLHRAAQYGGLGGSVAGTGGSGDSAPSHGGSHGSSGSHGSTGGHATTSGKGGKYEVRSGDSLSAIAARHGVTLSALIAANPQIKNPNLIYPGQKIRLPGAETTTKPSKGGKKGGKTGGTQETTSSADSTPRSKKGRNAYDVAVSVKGKNAAYLKTHGRLADEMNDWVPTNVCCANFVSSCLQESGLIKKSQHSDSVVGLASNLRNDPHWKRVPISQARPGDVVCLDTPGAGAYNHVVMFAGRDSGGNRYIGSNNVNADGSQRVTEGHMNYGVTEVFTYVG